MELKCPNCGEFISVENINIQEMVALCSECHQVFEFTRTSVARKAKHRKLKPPERIHICDDVDYLELSYRLVFGSGPAFGLVMAAFAATVSTILLVTAYLNHEPISLLIFLGLLALILSYATTVGVTTTTTIRADTEGLEVSSGPLPFPIKDDKTLSRADITRVFFEKSYQSSPPFPFNQTASVDHKVCAELQDGEHVPIVTSLPRSHARYIATALDDYLHEDIEVDNLISGDEFYDDAVQMDMAAEEVVARHRHGVN